MRRGSCLGSGVYAGVLFAALGCSPAPEDQTGAKGPLGAGGTDGGIGGSGTGASVSGPGGGSGGQNFFDIGGSGGDGGSGGALGKACAATSVRAETIEVTTEVEVPYEVVEEVPTVLYFMLDRSGSMVNDSFDLGNLLCGLFGGTCTSPTTKWEYAVQALSAFVQDPASAGLEAALHYFPGGGQCDGTGYDVPTVPMTPLPDSTAIIGSLAAQNPSDNTPTAGALRGATTYCANYNAASPDKQCVVVLITDGQPTDCDPRDGDGLGAIAEAAYTSGGVKTYAVGMDGADFGVLNRIAELGTGDCTPNDPATFACDVTASSGNTFIDALNLIRSRASTRTRTEVQTEVQSTILECEWDIPEPPPDEIFDPELVNVQFTAGSGDPQTIGAVETEADCANVESGWYYDNPADPQRVAVCPQTCDVIQTISDAQIDVLLGCEKKIAVPR